ncbi:MAG: hypothetical protein DWH91_05240 [Planctomycetota bacterium]|nr:MAG: hypothetical protein DWH91_05240 [Planctomycetota bacterium]
MPRHWLLLLTIAGLMTLLEGCANLPGALSKSQREPIVEPDTPKASPTARQKLSAPDPAEDKPPTRRPPAIAADSPPTEADPATRMLIDTELKDLPFEERRAWRSYLASIEPQRVPEILQRRRENPEFKPGDALTTPAVPMAPQPQLDPQASIVSDSESVNDESEPSAPAIQTASDDRDSSPSVFDKVEPAVSLTLAETEASSDPATPAETVSPAEANPATPSTAEATISSPDEKSAFDGMRIWPQGRRGDRSFSERLAATKLPLPAPWQRHEVAKSTETTPPHADLPARIIEPPRANPKAAYWQDELQKLISVMEAEVARTAGDTLADEQAHIQRQVYLRMLYLMAAQPEKAQLPITATDTPQQEFWTSVFWGMSNYFDESNAHDPVVRASLTSEQFQNALRHLQPQAKLQLHGLTFCQQIDGWGQYQPFERDEFEPGQPVLLYAEVQNFSSEMTPEGLFRTRIISQIEIVRLGAEPQVFDQEHLGEAEDLCRARRTDYCSSYRIELPTNLTPGQYELRLQVEDFLTQRTTHQSVGFRVR